MDHNEIRHALSDYLDGSLARAGQEAVEEHIKTCSQCSDALRDLRKTVEHIKSLEQVEPPAWMTRKVMTRVRGEAEKKGLFPRLFFPLHIKLPLEAFGVVLLALTAVFIYRNMQPIDRFSEQPASVFDKTAPPELKKEQPSRNRAAPGAGGLPQKPEYKALDMKQSYEPPPPPVLEKKVPAPAAGPPAPESPKAAGNAGFAEQPAMERPSPAREIEQDQARRENLASSKAKTKGFADQEARQSRNASPAAGPSSPEAADSPARDKTRAADELQREKPSGAHISIAVRSMPEASAQIEKTVKELGGAMLRKETSYGSVDLSVKLSPDRRPLLIEVMKKLGTVQSMEETDGDVMRIRLVGAAQ